jgi:hypothetical protein
MPKTRVPGNLKKGGAVGKMRPLDSRVEYLRSAGVTPEEGVAEAIASVASKRDRDGRWPLETRIPA